MLWRLRAISASVRWPRFSAAFFSRPVFSLTIRHAAACKVQQHARGWLGRRLLRRRVTAAVRLQAALRRRSAVVALRAALCAAIAIQAAGRREVAREKLQAALVAEEKEEEKWAASQPGGREQSASGQVREQWAAVERLSLIHI